jgi:hypothetical protein
MVKGTGLPTRWANARVGSSTMSSRSAWLDRQVIAGSTDDLQFTSKVDQDSRLYCDP